jgi:hypothetical protein
MKFGILCNFYGFPQYLDEVLKPWQNVSEDFIFSVASCKFDQYIDIDYLKEDKETGKLLKTKYKNLISFLWENGTSNDSIIRNKPLEYLISKNVDYIWILDADEFYSAEEINNIIKFIKFNEFNGYFKINFKNYFNDTSNWVDGFCPPRIFKMNVNNLKINKFYFENDLYYTNSNNDLIDYKNLSNLEIPKNIAHIKHYSWCGDKDFLRNKVKYQNLRYNGICSYKWNETEDKLDFNIDNFYSKFNLPVPKIYKD